MWRKLETLKRDLELRCDYTSLACYRAIDKCNEGNINTCNLSGFLGAHGTYALENELVQIIRRIDTSGDGRLTYSELADFIRSSHPSPVCHAPGVRCSSPVRHASPLKSVVRCPSPVRHCSPVRCSPVKYSCFTCRVAPCCCPSVHCSPVKYSCFTCRVAPCCCPSVHCSPVKLSCLSCRISPCCCKPTLHVPEED